MPAVCNVVTNSCPIDGNQVKCSGKCNQLFPLAVSRMTLTKSGSVKSTVEISLQIVALKQYQSVLASLRNIL